MISELDNFYLNKSEPNRSCLLALRSIILEQNEKVSETLKWGMPCFSFVKKIFCFLWTDKKTNEPYILFSEGNQLSHPKLEIGKRAKMKIFRVDPNKDLPLSTIKLILNEALQLIEPNLKN